MLVAFCLLVALATVTFLPADGQGYVPRILILQTQPIQPSCSKAIAWPPEGAPAPAGANMSCSVYPNYFRSVIDTCNYIADRYLAEFGYFWYCCNYKWENRSVFVLDLGENHLSSVGSNDMIALAIAENTVLQYLDLSYNGFSEKASYLIFMGLKSNSFIRTFLFGHNHVANKGCDGVYDALRNSETLWRVDLEHCAIVDKGAQAVANGITKNDSLKSLNLANNPIGVPGTTALLKAISNKEKLKSVDVSNCTVNAAFVTSAAALESQKELRIKHTGEGVPNKALPPYPIDLDALAAKAGKKKDNKTKK
ncbi:NACHT, LRR and PYD domains-containing protein 5-like [Paramacrobiotus metropolitanus]|uniref:NACHT, LRR and PYD domains-containing protein 5-like n=1 Tax=Paramacrobiotus metropolitanus TaxID=2943436 RepID=UPI002445883F|nr:NACHT, LRR and PYD domains-containing protein 5-like [Paramacrobiotus metropolitanus]